MHRKLNGNSTIIAITLSTMCPYEFPVHLYPRWVPQACLVCRNSMVAASISNRLQTYEIPFDSIRSVCHLAATKTASNDSRCVPDSRFQIEICRKVWFSITYYETFARKYIKFAKIRRCEVTCLKFGFSISRLMIIASNNGPSRTTNSIIRWINVNNGLKQKGKENGFHLLQNNRENGLSVDR